MKSFFDKPIITTTYYVGKPRTFNLIFQRDKFKRKINFYVCSIMKESL